MENKIALVLMAAFLVEFFIQALKKSVTKWEIVSTLAGIGFAFLLQVNLLDVILETEGWRWIAGVCITGVFLGRGASFVYDMFEKLKDVTKPFEIAEGILFEEATLFEEEIKK